MTNQNPQNDESRVYPYPHANNVEYYRKAVREYIPRLRSARRQKDMGWTPTDDEFQQSLLNCCWEQYRLALALRRCGTKTPTLLPEAHFPRSRWNR